MRAVFLLVRRELGAYLNTPWGWIILAFVLLFLDNGITWHLINRPEYRAPPLAGAVAPAPPTAPAEPSRRGPKGTAAKDRGKMEKKKSKVKKLNVWRSKQCTGG